MHDHILVVGTALAREFQQAIPDVRTSVISYAAAVGDIPVDPAKWLVRARQIDAAHPVDRVIAFGESEQVIAATIAADLQLTGHHSVEVATAVADKVAMRTRLADSGVGTVGFAEVDDALGIARFAQAYPQSRIIVKPVMGTGSRGVSEVAHAEQFEMAFTHAASVAPPVAGRQRVMAEELRPGRQLSVEGMSENGRHYAVAITQKYTDRRTFAEVGHCVPAQLSAEHAAAVEECMADTLDALGVRYGPTHTEVVLGASGRVDVIETHTRLGGHGIPGLVAAALGVDLSVMAFEQAAGRSVSSRLCVTKPRARSAEAVWFGYAPVAGRVHSVLGEARPGVGIEVLVNRGDVVTANMTRSSRVVIARASGLSVDDAVGSAARAVADTKVVIECAMTSQLLES